MSVNNTWMDLDNKFTTIGLDKPNMRGICQSSNSVTKVMYTEHPYVALCFKVEYTAQIPLQSGMDKFTLVVGWELFLPDINSLHDKSEDFHLTLRSGNQVSIGNELIWGDSSELKVFDLEIFGEISDDERPRMRKDLTGFHREGIDPIEFQDNDQRRKQVEEQRMKEI